MNKEIRLYNPELNTVPVENGTIRILDSTSTNLIEIGILDSETVPSEKLTRIINAVLGQLSMTWDGNAEYWDPMDRGIGGSIFISTPWMIIE